ncbi:M48 family metallopeptidase [Lentibacillus cibarius]|uniref:M48 family metallopeptidase n=1 Tax=Lentibacillus cibarius TaxID=2583219 RepID=A0A549YIR2_9BACI|nr:SprT family zinc-dependent metalloprotease [Lentibacillus cibarius]TRM11772.1 M48 family metallopeptidase [Lentibacillus cibarius]
MPTLNYGTTAIDYILHRQARADLKISVTLVGGVEVYAPESLNESAINRHLQKKASWILHKIHSLRQVETKITPYELISGEKLPYLGRYYRLKVHRDHMHACRLRFFQGRFVAEVPINMSQDEISQTLKRQLTQWYRRQATKRLHKRAAHFQSLMNITPNSMQTRTQHKRWGTCTPDGDIYINWRLIMAPADVFDYVIVHELAHLIIQDHSQAFWKVVKSILPNYEKQKEWLRINGMKLHCI